VDELFDVGGRAVLITGGAQGLGATFAEVLAARGARVMIADLDGAAAGKTTAVLTGDGHAHCQLDVRKEDECLAAVEATVDALGKLDVLINSAGIALLAPATELDIAEFEDTLAINLTGTFLMSRHAARVMIPAGGGRIINMASVSSEVINPEYAAYAASKAGVAHLTRILAIEWAKQNVTVNAIGPAVTPTPMALAKLEDPSFTEYQISKIPMGRFGEPRDLFGAMLLLASPAGAFITGQVFYVDGGRTLL
jgi:NAD(P)-dependent dehydrogenase (short-subunit alcohol dehydrogenase family)